MATPPEGFPLQFGTGIVKVNDEGIIIDARYFNPDFAKAEDDFHFIIANVSNFDIMNCIGGTVELVKFKPTLKLPDGSNQTPPPPEPVKPPTNDERIQSLETTVFNLMMQGGMLL